MQLAVKYADLFATRIWDIRLSELSPLFPGWIKSAEALRAAAPVPAGRSTRMGWNSSDKTVLALKEFAPLHGAIRACCVHAFKQMGLADPVFSLESWLNIHDRGGYNFQHLHDGAMLSGCFYLQVPEGAGALVLRDPRPAVLLSPWKGTGANAFKDVHLHPEEGLLVLFPNWLEHRVEPNESDTSRIAISFNALSR